MLDHVRTRTLRDAGHTLEEIATTVSVAKRSVQSILTEPEGTAHYEPGIGPDADPGSGGNVMGASPACTKTEPSALAPEAIDLARLSLLGSYHGPELVTEGRCLVLGGRSGRGKTHLAASIAYRAIQNGYDARFTTAAQLIDGYNLIVRSYWIWYNQRLQLATFWSSKG